MTKPMIATSDKPLRDWYGVTVSAGVEFEVPKSLEHKAKAAPFLKVKKTTKAKK